MSQLAQILTLQLQELLSRLESLSIPEEEVGREPTSLSMALVACRLLVERCRLEGNAPFGAWLRAVAGLLLWLRVRPAMLSPASLTQVTDLGTELARLLRKLDSGASLPDAADDDHLQTQQNRLLALGRLIPEPRAETGSFRSPPVIAESRTIPPAAPPVAPSTAPSAGSTSAPGSRPRRALLLLESSLRSVTVGRRLIDADWTTVECSDLSEAVGQLGGATAFDVFLCDNTEPRAHLRALAAHRRSHGDESWPPLVLVTGSESDRIRQLAVRLGAVGCWHPPFDPAALRRVLDTGVRREPGRSS